MTMEGERIVGTIKRTLDKYDPEGETIVIGTAGLMLAMRKHSEPIEDTIWTPESDVDVLAAMDYFRQVDPHKGGTLPDNTKMYYVNKYEGCVKRVEAGINLVPIDKSLEPDLLRFTALSNLTDERHDITYEGALQTMHVIDDRMVLDPVAILEWKLAVGREKDVKVAREVLRQLGSFDLR